MTLCTANALQAADASDLDQIRQEIRAIKENYESRLKALEQRLQEAEAKAANAEQRSAEAAPAPTSPSPRTGGNAFNPDIGLILSGTYQNLQRDPETYAIAGFIPGSEEIGPGSRSFNLGESELNLSANIDSYFFGALTAALSPDDKVHVEEAYFKTLALPAGMSLKGGRFFSGIGYLNEIHAHAWDFVDAPLVYQAFLGGQYGQEGLQFKWLAPTPVFLEFGLEGGAGRNFPGTDRNQNGVNGGAGFVHVGGDIGESISWRSGLSYLYHRPRDRAFEDQSEALGAASHAFSGKSKLMIADVTLKWAPNGNPVERNFKLQFEYFHSRETGTLASDFAGMVDDAGTTVVPALSAVGDFGAKKSGWYIQGVYQFLPRWRTGLRFEQLNSGGANIGTIGTTDESGTFSFNQDDFGLLKPYKPRKTSWMLEWNPSEFSRLRFQFAQDKARRDITDNQFFLQYIFSLGAHGGHKF